MRICSTVRPVCASKGCLPSFRFCARNSISLRGFRASSRRHRGAAGRCTARLPGAGADGDECQQARRHSHQQRDRTALRRRRCGRHDVSRPSLPHQQRASMIERAGIEASRGRKAVVVVDLCCVRFHRARLRMIVCCSSSAPSELACRKRLSPRRVSRSMALRRIVDRRMRARDLRFALSRSHWRRSRRRG